MEEYGIFQVIELLNERDKYHHQLCRIRCKECGREFVRAYSQVKSPSQLHLKCTHKKVNGNDKEYNYNWSNKRLRHLFGGILTRCYNVNDKAYCSYGAKGIEVCEDWLNCPKLFEEWALDNGYNDSLTIDRIDETKDYSPNNCRWISLEENARWKSTTNYIDVNGTLKTGTQWAKDLGFGPNLINTYIRTYGLENTIEFIRRYQLNPYVGKLPAKTSYYSIYMNK